MNPSKSATFTFIRILAGVLCLFFFQALHAAEDAWPIFRGDQQMRGVATSPIPENPVQLWRFPTESPINSSAVIAEDRVFVGSDDGNVYALNLLTGEKIWSAETGGKVEASPLYLRGKIYIGSSDTWFYCLDAQTGKKLWKFETGDKILGSANWADTQTSAGTLIIFGSYDMNLYGLSAETGKKIWNYETTNFINGAPAVSDDRAIFGGCDGILHMVSVNDGTTSTAQIDIDAYIAGTVAVDAGKGYLGHYDHVFLCADLKSKKIDWKYRDKAFPFFSSAALSKDSAVFGGRDKRVHCVERNSGNPVWTFPTGGQIDSSPVIYGDRIVIGSDDGRLYILDMKDGHEVWSTEIGGKIFATPAVCKSIIVVGSHDGAVYAFGKVPKKADR